MTSYLVIKIRRHVRKEVAKNIPKYVRVGMLLLVMGAIIVGIGTYLSKGSLSLYGLIMAICGFVIYFAASIASRRKICKSEEIQHSDIFIQSNHPFIVSEVFF